MWRLHLKSTRIFLAMLAVGFFATIVFPAFAGTAHADSPPVNGTVQVTPPNCLHTGGCTTTITCPNGTTYTNNGTKCCPTNTTLNAAGTTCVTNAGANNGGANNTATATTPTCQTSGDPLSWIVCGLFDGAAHMADWALNSIVVPFLITQPLAVNNTNDPTYKVWNSFRIYGDIFLVIALIVLVLGQAIGGGGIEAYTIRKALPRVLIAAILVNVSIYIVALMVDITNVLGNAISGIIIEPFRAAGSWNFKPTGGQDASAGIAVLSVGLIGYFLHRGGGAGIHTILGHGLFNNNVNTGSFSKAAVEIAIFLIIPILLALLAVLVTLIIRKGLILFLILIAPVAFALYCLPNTEKYFKRWWDILLEALLVFPIVMIIFAVADVLSITILNANGLTPKNIDTTQQTGTRQ
jgi:hypothetical protein